MNLITADFNWISLVVIIVAGTIGMLKSRSGKSGYPSETNFPEFEPWAEALEEEHFEEEAWERIEETPVSPEPPEVADHSEQACPEKEAPVHTAAEDEREEERPAFDIRQAIISSEILKRPEF